jgi:serine protease AprX
VNGLNFDERYPARYVKIQERDYRGGRSPNNNYQGNASPWFHEEREPFIKHLHKLRDQITDVSNHFEKWFIKYPTLPVPLVVNMLEEAFAKSHRPDSFLKLNKSSIISIHQAGKMIVSVDSKVLHEMIQNIEKLALDIPDSRLEWIEIEMHEDKDDNEKVLSHRKNAYELLHELSAISSFKRYTEQDVLIEFHNEIQIQASDDEEIKIRFFNFDNQQINDGHHQIFQQTFENRGLNTSQIRRISMVDDILTYSIPFVANELFQDITRYPGVELISSFLHISMDETQNNLVVPMNIDILMPEPDKKYPKIALVDGGIIPTAHIHPWIKGKYIEPSISNTQNRHANFIAALINYGHILNPTLKNVVDSGVQILDVVLLPDGKYHKIREYEFLPLLENALIAHSKEYKVWNLSLNSHRKCIGIISEFTAAIDVLQDKYQVIFVVSAGNYSPGRKGWPYSIDFYDQADRITLPADSQRAITVGSIALTEGPNSSALVGEPTDYSRKGPGIGYSLKPNTTHFSGNDKDNLIISMNDKGDTDGDRGTSFSAPLTAALIAETLDQVPEVSLITAKAILMHSARHPDRPNEIVNGRNRYYYGFGLPKRVFQTLYGNEHEITLIFEGNLLFDKNKQQSWLRIGKFPFPKSLAQNDKLSGEIILTLCYEPPLSPRFGCEYSRCNLHTRLRTINGIEFKTITKGAHFKDLKPRSKHEKRLMIEELKWSPNKQYPFQHPLGVKGIPDIILEVYPTWRDNNQKKPVPFTVIATIRDPKRKAPVYNEVVQLLQGFICEEIQVSYVPVTLGIMRS